MRQTFHPALFLGAVILLCAAWLWAKPPEPVVERLARNSPQPVRVAPASIALDTAILERYPGKYEGRGGFTVDLTLKDGKLLAQSGGSISSIPLELRPTSETKFFLKSPNFNAAVDTELEFDVARDGTVRGFAASTPFGPVEVKRVR